jgi:hypothetical protein
MREENFGCPPVIERLRFNMSKRINVAELREFGATKYLDSESYLAA